MIEAIRRPRRNYMAVASLVFGVLSILSVFTLDYAVLFGCLSILFATLSRGGSLKMPDKAIGGLVVSIFAMVISLVLTVLSWYIIIQMFGLETALNPEALQEAVTEFYNNFFNSLSTGGGAPL